MRIHWFFVRRQNRGKHRFFPRSRVRSKSTVQSHTTKGASLKHDSFVSHSSESSPPSPIDRRQHLASFALLAITAVCAALLVYPFPIKTVATNASGSLAGKTIVVDAGHGGFDPGTSGANNVKEAPLNLAVAKLLESELRARGVKVVMTRKDDEALGDYKYADMEKRSQILNNSNADAAVSIHMNHYAKSGVNGPMVFYYPNSEKGEVLAQAVQNQLDKALDRSKTRTAQSANYFVLRESPTLSILVECGFLSNPDDLWLMQKESHQRKIAVAIADGLENYFATQPKITPTSSITVTPAPNPSQQP